MNPNGQSVETQEPTRPEWFDFPSRDYAGDLVLVAQGAALVLHGVREHLKNNGDWENVVGGLTVALASVANRVDVYTHEDIGICLEADAVDPESRLYVLEKQVAKVRAKIAAKQRGRS